MENLSTDFLNCRDAKIAYREHGNGSTIILLHGNSASKALFEKYQLLHFDDFHTIAIDSRGHGETQSNDTQYSINQFSEDVIAFCKAKDIARAYVIGYSDGGNIALFLAAKEPTVFKKVAAISPNYLASGMTDGTLRFFRATARLLKILHKLGLPAGKPLMRFELMLNDIGITKEELGGIRTNLRILYAENDMIKEEHIMDMHKLIPGSTVRKIEHSNHVTIFNKQETIDDIKDYFLGDVSS
jgi:phosphatidylglycerol lysyltransferase